MEHRDTITAEKLHNPVVIGEIKLSHHSGVIKEDDFIDPIIGGEKAEGNYNSFERKPWEKKKKRENEG